MAGTLGTYYFDGMSFANATMLYTDSALTTVAANGYYSQNGIVRQLVGGPGNPVLLQPQACVGCSAPCGSGVSGGGGTGRYNLTVNLGNSVGACIVTFDPQSVPDICTWTYDGASSSESSSSTEGHLEGVVGTIAAAASCNLSMSNASGSGGSTVTGSTFEYDAGTSQFVNTGTPATLGPYSNQASNGVDFTTNAPGDCIMVVPKPNATPETVTFAIEGPCTGTAWTIDVACPTALTAFDAGTTQATEGAACADTVTADSMYNAPVAGSAGNPAVTDWVFSDANGVNKISDGWYKISATQAANIVNSVIVTINTCSVLTSFSSSDKDTVAGICNDNSNPPIDQTYYHNGSGTYPAINDNVYSDSAGSSPVSAGEYLYQSAGGVNSYFVVTGLLGVVSSLSTCTPPTTIFYMNPTTMAACNTWCDGTNRTITVPRGTTNNHTYANVVIGDIIAGTLLGAGHYAYAASSTDTATGTFQILQVDASNEVLSISQCDGTSCVPI